jgi:plasmid stabilization system protein ParE
MELKWTSKALSDVAKLYDFLAVANKIAAAKTVQSLTSTPSTPSTLLINSRIGERLEGYTAREVRRILVGQYEIRYEINNSVIYVLRIWHTRENR